MLFNSLNPHMTKKIGEYISNVGRDLALAMNYVIETWLQKKFIYTKLTQGLVPKEKSKCNLTFDSQEIKALVLKLMCSP
jgi:hypothetical protein